MPSGYFYSRPKSYHDFNASKDVSLVMMECTIKQLKRKLFWSRLFIGVLLVVQVIMSYK